MIIKTPRLGLPLKKRQSIARSLKTPQLLSRLPEDKALNLNINKKSIQIQQFLLNNQSLNLVIMERMRRTIN